MSCEGPCAGYGSGLTSILNSTRFNPAYEGGLAVNSHANMQGLSVGAYNKGVLLEYNGEIQPLQQANIGEAKHYFSRGPEGIITGNNNAVNNYLKETPDQQKQLYDADQKPQGQFGDSWPTRVLGQTERRADSYEAGPLSKSARDQEGAYESVAKYKGADESESYEKKGVDLGEHLAQKSGGRLKFSRALKTDVETYADIDSMLEDPNYKVKKQSALDLETSKQADTLLDKIRGEQSKSYAVQSAYDENSEGYNGNTNSNPAVIGQEGNVTKVDFGYSRSKGIKGSIADLTQQFEAEKGLAARLRAA